MTKLNLSLLILLLVFSGCGARHHYTQAQSKPPETKEAFALLTFDFGKVKEGEVLKHEFILKNETSKILNIKDVNTSCGCTVSEVEKKNLSPGESTVIKVKFNTQGYSGLTQQYIYIHTDNLDNPVIRYIIKAEVIK
jgi:uncharacterized cupredoxin-like copper-binding protein